MDRAALTDAPAPAGPPSGGFGRLAFGFLFVSALSGVALTPLWSAAAARDSLERIEGGIAWGFFLRGLHAWSSWGVLVALALHFGQVLWKRTEPRLPAAVWWRSVLLLPLTVGAILSGFVLRGDAEAVAALAIWRRLLTSIPLLGAETARFALGASAGDLGAPALHHAATFTLLLWLFTAEHAGTLFPDGRGAALAGLVSAALAGTIPLRLGAPPSNAPAHLLGPWPLLGLQGALEIVPAWVGWAAPLAFVLALGFLRGAEGRVKALLVSLVALGLAADALFTVRVLLSARG